MAGFIENQESAFASLASLFTPAVVVDACDVTTGWAVKNNDTTTLATSASRVEGVASLSFAKVNGAANTVFGAIKKTVALDLSKCKPWDSISFYIYLSALTDVATVPAAGNRRDELRRVLIRGHGADGWRVQPHGHAAAQVHWQSGHLHQLVGRYLR